MQAWVQWLIMEIKNKVFGRSTNQLLASVLFIIQEWQQRDEGHPLMAHLTGRKDQTVHGQDVDPKPYHLRSLWFNKNPTIRTVSWIHRGPFWIDWYTAPPPVKGSTFTSSCCQNTIKSHAVDLLFSFLTNTSGQATFIWQSRKVARKTNGDGKF